MRVKWNASKSGIFPIKATQDERLKILTLKQMLHSSSHVKAKQLKNY